MRLIFGVLLVVSLSVANTITNKEQTRDKRDYVILVPHVPVFHPSIVVQPIHPAPAAPAMMAPMRAPMRPISSVPQSPMQQMCGTPAYTCSGPCKSRNVGGIPAVQAEMPWNAQIYSSNRHICSGTLVDNKFILTSASCVDPTTPQSVAALRVRLGDFNRGNTQDGQHYEANVTTVYRHSDFVSQKANSAPLNNIALLKLTVPVQFTDRIRPICLDEAQTRVDTGLIEGTVAGYGVLSYSNRPQTDDLYKVNVRIGTTQECQNTYSQHGYRLTDREICAGVDQVGLPDPCVGDDGGPLIVQSGPNMYKQVGVASFGIRCSGPPQVYTRISSYRSWIDQVRYYYQENY